MKQMQVQKQPKVKWRKQRRKLPRPRRKLRRHLKLLPRVRPRDHRRRRKQPLPWTVRPMQSWSRPRVSDPSATLDAQKKSKRLVIPLRTSRNRTSSHPHLQLRLLSLPHQKMLLPKKLRLKKLLQRPLANES